MRINNNFKISSRLEKIALFIPQGLKFADIGSDHAYLPCYVCLHDQSAHAIAGEVNEGPFQRAQETVARFDLSDRIEVRLGNGLEVLQDGEVNLIVIAGMGGSLIKTILDEGKDCISSVERIIAQPNIDECSVRHWFYSHGYTIVDEAMVEENGHIYEIIVADRKNVTKPLNEKQLLFGPYLLKQKSDLFYRKWQHERNKRKRTVEQIKNANVPDEIKIAAFTKEVAWIEEVLNDDNS